MKLYDKIKKKPEDFIVEEITKAKIEENGKYFLLELYKRNVSTLEALRILSKYTKIPLKKIGFAGLKDKFAITKQYLTIPKEYPINNLCFKFINGRWTESSDFSLENHMGFTIQIVGETNRWLTLGDLRGNKFTITIRNFEKSLRERFYRNYQIVKNYGFPNYFGEQRFGSVKSRDNFILLYLLKGDYESAIKSYFFGKSNINFWGDWRKLYKTLAPSLEEYEKDLIKGLMRGLTPEKAFRILPKNVRLMFNFAFQSFLWNETLRLYIESKYPFVRVPFINNWKLSYYLELPAKELEYLKNLEIPFTAKEHKIADRLLEISFKKVMNKYQIQKEWLNKEVIGIKVLTDGLRKAIVFPENFKFLEKTKREAKITFTLPPGSYATVLLRFLLKG